MLPATCCNETGLKQTCSCYMSSMYLVQHKHCELPYLQQETKVSDGDVETEEFMVESALLMFVRV